MSQQLTVAEANQVAALDSTAWGEENLTAQDLVLPKILAMNHMSDKVKQRKAEYGEFRDSLDNRLLGSLTKPLEFVPFHMEKQWVVYNLVKGKREYSHTEEVTFQNEGLKYVDEAAGTSRDKVYTFYVLLTKDVEAGTAFPHVLSFRRTSMRAGQQLATHMYGRNKRAGLPPAATVFSLGGKSVSSDDGGEYVVCDVSSVRSTSDVELGEAFGWFKTVKAGATKVDEAAE